MIVFVQAGSNGAIKIARTRNAHAYIASLQKAQPASLVLLAMWPEARNVMERLRRTLHASHIRDGWYEPSDALLALVARGNLRDTRAVAIGVQRSDRLSDHEVREVFTAAHAVPHESDAVIGARYGVSHITVGTIARGQSHTHLIGRDDAPTRFNYYVFDRAVPHIRFHMVVGRRRR